MGYSTWSTYKQTGIQRTVTLGRVIVRIGKNKTNVIVKNDEIRCYCMEGLERVIPPESVRLELLT